METKRIVSLLLICAILVVTNSNVFANENSKLKVIECVKKDGKTIKEISKIGNTYYYYEDNNKFTLSISRNSNGHVEVNMKDKSNPSIINSTMLNNRIKKDYVTDFKEIRENILEERIELNKKVFIPEDYTNLIKDEHHAEIANNDIMLIRGGLVDKYGEPYRNKYLESLTERGLTAKLYESKNFEIYRHHDWLVYAGTTAGAIAALISIPMSAVAAVLTLVSLGSGVYGVVEDIMVREFVANVHYNKTVNVGNSYPYRAGKTEKNRAIVGDKDIVILHKDTIADHDYNDNYSLLKKGIDNYIKFN
ncbi:MAG TPA: hypothetical protein GXX63_10480 [Tissierellia bacterium]|nr:hypothetical protein [Tissierellia bacterium]